MNDIADLDLALRELGVCRVGAVFAPVEGGVWWVTLTTREADSRSAQGATLAEALLACANAVLAMREEGAQLLRSKAAS